MNFEEAFNHYREGVATPEEKEYVREQLDKAKALSNLFDDEGINVTPAPIAEADAQDIKKAKRQFVFKRLAFALVSVVAVLLVVAAILGGVFGSAATYGNRNIVYGREECAEFAKDYAFDVVSKGPVHADLITSPDDFRVSGVDKHFNYDPMDIRKSYYVYRIELKAMGYEFEINVDTRIANSCTLHSLDKH